MAIVAEHRTIDRVFKQAKVVAIYVYIHLMICFKILQMYGMAVANKLDNSRYIFQRRYFRQVSGPGHKMRVHACFNCHVICKPSHQSAIPLGNMFEFQKSICS